MADISSHQKKMELVIDSSVGKAELWFKRAKPHPTDRDFQTQLGVHFEEFGEMLDVLQFTSNEPAFLHLIAHMRSVVKETGDRLKKGTLCADVTDAVEFCDSLHDQIVTATGTGYMKGFKMMEGFAEVNRSNFSKFDVNGNPIIDNNGKIMKGPDYRKPELINFI